MLCHDVAIRWQAQYAELIGISGRYELGQSITRASTLARSQKRYSTRYSRVVTQRSTDLAQSSLPSVIGRERGYSGWYDSSMEARQF